MKSAVKDKKWHERQSNDERLYVKREDGRGGLKSLKEVYHERKVGMACYMSMSSSKWIAVSWRNELHNEQTLLKKQAENLMRTTNEQVLFNPFVPNTPFLYPLKTTENLKVF